MNIDYSKIYEIRTCYKRPGQSKLTYSRWMLVDSAGLDAARKRVDKRDEWGCVLLSDDCRYYHRIVRAAAHALANGRLESEERYQDWLDR